MTKRKIIEIDRESCNGCGGCVADGAARTSLREQLIAAMFEQFGDDKKRIDHALAVFSYADQIRNIEGGNTPVVTAAALLHDIGIQEGERIYGSNAPRYQELLGPPIARRIMEDLSMDEATVQHVTRIVGSHHSAGDIDTIEFRIIWDADALVNLTDEGPPRSTDQWEKTIEKVFRTGAGKNLARRLFIRR
ncbi:MAG: HD domain-containing protein [Deltaproteobacteria bacterium]|nr:HD domain-containing protein [Candidatus Zymogenaceae bacterium]